MTAALWTYRARLERVVDGDTLDVIVDLGFGVTIAQRVRLDDIDTPERYTEAGKAATAFVRDWLAARSPEDVPWPLTLRSSRPLLGDKYGRYLATIVAGGESLADATLAAGHAVPYHGGAR